MSKFQEPGLWFSWLRGGGERTWLKVCPEDCNLRVLPPRAVYDHDHHAMLFSWRIRNGKRRLLGIRPCWFTNLRAFLWWGPVNPKTGKKLPPGVWCY